jgi:hypothetical protein
VGTRIFTLLLTLCGAVSLTLPGVPILAGDPAALLPASSRQETERPAGDFDCSRRA